MSEPFIAEVRIFAGNFAPRGWAFCNGQLLPIAQNTALFSLIGVNYGGDGRSTTALPNMQGRAPMHPGRGPGLTARQLGEVGGTSTVTLTEAQMPIHKHTLKAAGGRTGIADSNTPTDASLASTEESSYTSTNTNTVTMDEQSLPNTGGSQPHNNMQPFLAINFIIALVGLYPSRS